MLGATIVAGFGSAFAALGDLAPFSITLLVGIAVMFWGFLRASTPVSVPVRRDGHGRALIASSTRTATPRNANLG